jgi:hypothetical protein
MADDPDDESYVRTEYWPEKELEWWRAEVKKLKQTLSEYSLRMRDLENELRGRP